MFKHKRCKMSYASYHVFCGKFVFCCVTNHIHIPIVFHFLKALAEEREVYDRASSRSIYLNLSVNALKRLRKGTGTTQPPSAPSNNRFAVSHQAVLGGKAATLTTFTLHRNSKTQQIYDGKKRYMFSVTK